MLGNYVEVVLTVKGMSEAGAFFEKQAFKRLDHHVLTDGCYNLRLVAGDTEGIALHYYGTDLAALQSSGIRIDGDMLTSPNGVRIVLSSEASAHPMPDGEPMTRTPISRLGKFGEFAISVEDFEEAVAFWKSLGLKQAYATTEPYPFGILMDDLFVVGIHQNREHDKDQPEGFFDSPRITYFEKDMSDRIKGLKADGLPIDEVLLSIPGQQKMFLFTVEI